MRAANPAKAIHQQVPTHFLGKYCLSLSRRVGRQIRYTTRICLPLCAGNVRPSLKALPVKLFQSASQLKPAEKGN